MSRRPVEIPCRRQCRMGEDRYCLGCGWRLDDMVAWRRLRPGQRRAIIDGLRAWDGGATDADRR